MLELDLSFFQRIIKQRLQILKVMIRHFLKILNLFIVVGKLFKAPFWLEQVEVLIVESEQWLSWTIIAWILKRSILSCVFLYDFM